MKGKNTQQGSLAEEAAKFCEGYSERIKLIRTWRGAKTLKEYFEADPTLYDDMAKALSGRLGESFEDVKRAMEEEDGFERTERLLGAKGAIRFEQSDADRNEALEWLADVIGQKFTEESFEDGEYRKAEKAMDFIGNEIAKG